MAAGKTTKGEAPDEDARPARARVSLDLRRFLPYRFYSIALRMAAAKPSLSDVITYKGLPISERDWRVLVLVADEGTISQREIGHRIGMDPATVSRSLQHLENEGYVLTRRGKRDKRRSIVTLSERGADAHDLVAPARLAVGRDLERYLGRSDLAVLHALLDKLEACLDEREHEGDDDSSW